MCKAPGWEYQSSNTVPCKEFHTHYWKLILSFSLLLHKMILQDSEAPVIDRS